MKKQRYNPKARRQARQLIVQGLYAKHLASLSFIDILNILYKQPDCVKADREFLEHTLRAIMEELEVIDQAFKPYLDRAFEDLDPVEIAILRLGTYEMLFYVEIPERVVLNESIELAKLLGASESHKYINGILHQVAKQYRAIAP